MKLTHFFAMVFIFGSGLFVQQSESIEWSWTWFRNNFLPTRMDSDSSTARPRAITTTPAPYNYPTWPTQRTASWPSTTTTGGWGWDWVVPTNTFAPPTTTRRAYPPSPPPRQTNPTFRTYGPPTTTPNSIIRAAPTIPQATGTTNHGQQMVCACGEEASPVCASNGITYKNRCKFDCAQHRVTRLRVVRNGSCDNVNRNDYWGSDRRN